jgi:hypothetical protein
MTENQEPNQLETSYAKGENFEKQFAEFMKAELGWSGYRIRSQQKGRDRSGGAQIDIIAEKQDKRGKSLQILAFVYCAIMAIGVIVGLLYEEDAILIFAGITGIVAVFVAFISRAYHKENAWVECKNRKSKTTFDQVNKSLREYNDYKATGDKEYKFVNHYYVSANGFVEDALKFAEKNGIICYKYENEKFVLDKYWK